MRRWAARALTAYTRRTPVARGKYRLAALARALDGDLPSPQPARARDGRCFDVDPYSPTYGSIFYLGEYEPGVTRVLRAAVRPGDLCVDAGANIGWHATLMARLSGPPAGRPRVHAFEPHPDTFAQLTANVARSGLAEAIVPVAAALGDGERDATLFRFERLPEGHASLRSGGRADAIAVQVAVTTLDAYVRRCGIAAVDVLKADVEGAELLLARGAAAVLNQDRPPLLVVEMARATASPFGYEPNDLIAFLAGQGGYRFFRIDDATGRLDGLVRFGPADPGANVLCVPSGHFADRLARLGLR
jgi:FkbM family methyltransferase